MSDNIRAFLPFEDIEQTAQQQIKNMATLSILDGNIAIMPDCHFGKGATVGSVIPTYKAIIPAAVGVDIGCGMEAVKLPFKGSALDARDLQSIFNDMCKLIPLGAGGRHQQSNSNLDRKYELMFSSASPKLQETIKALTSYDPRVQLGTLGSGNHFIELCIDQNDDLWLMLHSGSRGIGNRIGTHYIEMAKEKCHELGLPDSDLSFLSQGDEHFSDYCEALQWAQHYAAKNRRVMLETCFAILKKHNIIADDYIPVGNTAISCHHNYVEFIGPNNYLTRKGAISAKSGEMGIIPGSMGTKSYIVRGKGNPDSHCSASHGAGRSMSRGQAKRMYTVEDLKNQTEGVVCLKNESVLDEIPSAYKDIDVVMERQKDLVEVVYILKQIMNVKGG